MATKKEIESVPARELMPDLYNWMLTAAAYGTIYVNVRRVSRSGMSRDISLYTIGFNEHRPSLMKAVPDFSFDTKVYASIKRRTLWNDKEGCFRIGGSGMDMAFALIYHLAHIFEFTDPGQWVNCIRLETL